MVKACSCGEIKPFDDFSPVSVASSRDRRYSYCRPCPAAKSRAWKKANRGKQLESLRSVRLKQYGLTIESYDVLCERQGGVCASCGEAETALSNGLSIKRLTVDHDHATGSVRGLLCNRCNVMIGMARDDPARLRRGADYLERQPFYTEV